MSLESTYFGGWLFSVSNEEFLLKNLGMRGAPTHEPIQLRTTYAPWSTVKSVFFSKNCLGFTEEIDAKKKASFWVLSRMYLVNPSAFIFW